MKSGKNSTKILPIENWKETKFISGRVATKSDVENGSATFYLEGIKEHTAVNINLPTLARLEDFEEINDDYWEVVVIIQFESYFNEEYSEYNEFIGYRRFNGETGSCLPWDIKWLRDSEIEKFK